MNYPIGAWFEFVRMSEKFGSRSSIAKRAYVSYKRQYDTGLFDSSKVSCSDYLFDIYPTGYQVQET